MTIVFGGIDLPIFEILFVVSILLICGLVIMILGLIYILKEIKSLRNLLTREEEDIKKFEKDIAELEKFEGKEESDIKALEKYIKNNLNKGFRWDQIKKALVDQGHSENDLNEIYSSLK